MTATIDLPDGSTVTLNDYGDWEGENAALARMLNILCGKAAIPPSPAAGESPFAAQAVAAGRVLGLPVQWPESGGNDKEIVY